MYTFLTINEWLSANSKVIPNNLNTFRQERNGKIRFFLVVGSSLLSFPTRKQKATGPNPKVTPKFALDSFAVSSLKAPKYAFGVEIEDYKESLIVKNHLSPHVILNLLRFIAIEGHPQLGKLLGH